MSQVDTLPAPTIEKSSISRSKWEREFQAFKRLLPQLLATHRGKYVAIHEEQVADIGDDGLELALRVLARMGNADIHVGLVSEEPDPVSRSGVRRDVQPARVGPGFSSAAML